LLQQAPGVNQDSAVSFEGPVHVRLEHGFIQYRINGILLPDGATGFTQVLETGFISNLALVTGALPAQYGFRTSGLVDVTTRTGFAPGGDIGIYGGGRQAVTPYFDYGGTVGNTEYFVTGRYFENSEGIENPTSSLNAIHDHTAQGKFFGYASTLLDDTTRLSFITGSSLSQFQIPNNPAQVPAPGSLPVPGITSFNSSQLNENQFEQNFYNVVALQKKIDDLGAQLSYFTRYSNVHFVPDPLGDLFFNNVASDVDRSSFLNGIQGDGAYRINDSHTVRAGFLVSSEQTRDNNSSLVLSTGVGGACGAAPECTIVDNIPKLGWLLGTYVQDEWRIADKLTLNTGLRFDQMWEFVDANQLSPRASLVYEPIDGMTLHAGYARYFTPASQPLSATPTLTLYQNTTLQPSVAQADPVLPERAHYFDVGVEQRMPPGLDVGVDAYYKLARDQIDVGQFGQALVLDEYNYEKGFNEGVEFKVKYQNGDFRAYGNLAWAQQFATNVVSQQYLFDPTTLAHIATHTIYTDLSQRWTGSAGISYLWQGTRFSADMIYGSGLRAGFANTQSMAPYAQFNVGVTGRHAGL
jgi:outer membrane receptor protein involved in Fe transport